MPNYGLVLNARFKPFSYQEMLAPVMAATQAHQALETEYGLLEEKANVWERIANEQPDSDAYKMYKKYSDDLKTMAGQLARNGLSSASRREMLGMKSRYNSEILPIEVAYKRREELAAEQRKALAQNPTLRYQRYASQLSIDDLIKNPSLDYGKSYSGALLTQQVSQAAANYAKVLTEEGGLEKLGLPYQYKSRIRHGASPKEILAVINNAALDGHQGAIGFLKSIRDQVIQSSGITDWADPSTLRELISFANQGLYSALGQTEIKNYTDQFSMQDAVNARQLSRQRAAAQQDRLKMYNVNPTSLYGTSEVSAMNKATLRELDKWRSLGYFNRDGKLTKAGWKALQYRPASVKGHRYDSHGRQIPVYNNDGAGNYEFYNWAKKQGVTDTSDRYSINILNNYYSNTLDAANSGQLVTGTPNIDVYRLGIKGEQMQTYLQEKTTAALAGGNIFKVGKLNVSRNGEVTMDKGDAVSAKEFKKAAKDNPILYIINSPTTNNQLIEMADGTKYIMPKGMLDNFNWENLNRVGDPSDPNSQLGNNQRLKYAGSDYERAVILNQSQSYLGSLLDSNTGTEVASSDGTISMW